MAFPPRHSFVFNTTHHEDPDLHLSQAPSSLNNLNSFPPQHFQGGNGGMPFMMKKSLSFSGVDTKSCINNNHHQFDHQDLHGEPDKDDLSDDGSQLLGEKKKRLNIEQVKTLEKSFEIDNKLEPERKLQLAKALSLQPRQVAIWFQNRRARWKTKQLEKDYDALKKKFDALKSDNDALQNHNNKLQAELMAIKGSKDSIFGSKNSIFGGGLGNNMKKETDQSSWSYGSNDDVNNSDHNNINLDMSRSATPLATSPTNKSNTTTHFTNGSRNLFPSSRAVSIILEALPSPHASNIAHLPQQGSSRMTSADHHGYGKVDQMIQEDQAFSTMFNNNGGIEQDHQVNFWPWPAEQPRHFH